MWIRRRNRARDCKDDNIDRLSDLPDSVLLHIMEFVEVKQAVQTCVLSKRWKNLWKCLASLKLHSTYFSPDDFNKFVFRILYSRDTSVTLRRLDFRNGFSTSILNMKKVMNYAVSHHIQQLTMRVTLSCNIDFELPPSILCCRSLTFLKLVFDNRNGYRNAIKCPRSLDLPAVKTLHISNVTFSKSDDGYVEPFSTCSVLNTLVMENCFLQNDAKVLCITNSKLSNLSMVADAKINDYKVVLSTPNLHSVIAKGCFIPQLSAACSFPFIQELNIDFHLARDIEEIGSVLISWLQVLANIRILTLSWGTIKILNGLLKIGSLRTQAPYFSRLESLNLDIFAIISDGEVSKVVECLLQNSQSPLTMVDIIKN